MFLGKKARTFDVSAMFEQTRRTAQERSQEQATSSTPAPEVSVTQARKDSGMSNKSSDDDEEEEDDDIGKYM